MSYELEHPQVTIRLKDAVAEVDEELAPLILELWKAGCWTSLSCQNTNGRVWICFPYSGFAETFLSIVADAYSDDIDSLYNRTVGEWEPANWRRFRKHRKWSYSVTFDDENIQPDFHPDTGLLVNIKPIGSPDIRARLSVRFPRGDLPEVLRRLQAHNAAARE